LLGTTNFSIEGWCSRRSQQQKRRRTDDNKSSMEKKKPSNSHQASYQSLCDTTEKQQQQKNGSTQTPKTRTIFATTKFPEVPRRPDSPVFKFADTSARLRNNKVFSLFGGVDLHISLRKIIRAVLLYYFCTTCNTSYCGTLVPNYLFIYLLKRILAILYQEVWLIFLKYWMLFTCVRMSIIFLSTYIHKNSCVRFFKFLFTFGCMDYVTGSSMSVMGKSRAI
jgi:hypothetical protein